MRKIHVRKAAPSEVRQGLSRGRSSRLWKPLSPVTFRSAHGHSASTTRISSGNRAPPRNGPEGERRAAGEGRREDEAGRDDQAGDEGGGAGEGRTPPEKPEVPADHGERDGDAVADRETHPRKQVVDHRIAEVALEERGE